MIEPREADQLAQRARRGDPLALARLYREYAPPLLGFLRRLTRDEATAEDVLHEVFLRVLEGRGRFRARGRFRQWLFAVAANAARDQRRRDQGRERSLESLAGEAMPGHAPPPDEALAGRETLRLVESVLDDLPADYGATFHLRVREGFSYREIAAMTGDAEGTLRSRVHHTMQRLRDRLTAADARPGSRAGKEES